MRFAPLLILLTLCLPVFAGAAETKVQNVLIISIDGLRPDVMLRARTPNLQEMMKHGSFTLWARTVPQAITLPSHVSMLTGVTPERHGVQWNADLPLEKKVYPAVDTLFDIAKRQGLSTMLVAGKSKFDVFDRPGSIDHNGITREKKSKDDDVTAAAVETILRHKPQVMMLHLPSADSAGHKFGWGSAEQIDTVSNADACVGRVLAAISAAGMADSTLVIVTSDHGGAGRTHGPEDARSRTIPWIAVGPGVRENVDLTLLGRGHEVNTYDTFSTAADALGLKVSPNLDGKPIHEIWTADEIHLSTDAPSMAPATGDRKDKAADAPTHQPTTQPARLPATQTAN